MLTMTKAELLELERQVHQELWLKHDLQFMLDEGADSGPQHEIYNGSKSCKHKTFVTEASRRLGKTYVHAIIAIELALKNPGSKIIWCQDTTESIQEQAVPLFEKICRDAPEKVKGVTFGQKSFRFPNGSYIQFVGIHSREDADRARGGDNPIAAFFDEAGYADFLEYAYVSIIKPAMRRTRRNGHFGMLFLCSSTPELPSHYFIKLANRCRARKSYFRATIYNSKDPETFIAEDAEDFGLSVEEFKLTTHFRREYMCERVIDEAVVIFHAFHRHEAGVVVESVRPVGFDRFVIRLTAIDPGGVRDPTGILFGYVDYPRGKFVIEDELLLPKTDTGDIATQVQAKELELWPDCDPKQNASRVVDDPTGRFCLDLGQLLPPLKPLRARPATKHDRNASISIVNNYVTNGQLEINPRCVQLQLQLKEAMSTKNGKDFKRDENGHSDLCTALMYMLRDAPKLTTNPYPADYDVETGKQLPASHPIMLRRQHFKKLQPQTGIAGAFGR